MSQNTPAVYLRCGVADYRPPAVWQEASAGGDASLQQYWESERLQDIYAENLLWTGFERLVTEAVALAGAEGDGR